MKTIEDKIYKLNELSMPELYELKKTYRDIDCGLCDNCYTRYAIVEQYIFHAENRRNNKIYQTADLFVSRVYGDDWR